MSDSNTVPQQIRDRVLAAAEHVFGVAPADVRKFGQNRKCSRARGAVALAMEPGLNRSSSSSAMLMA